MAFKEGWNWIFGSPKWHYFRDGKSLCGKWMILGKNESAETGNDESKSNCKVCSRKKLKEKSA